MTDALTRLTSRTRVKSPLWYISAYPMTLYVLFIGYTVLEPESLPEVLVLLVTSLALGTWFAERMYREAYLRKFGGATADE